jgi:hypothetical protein
LKDYIESALEEEIGLPVEVKKFTLDSGKAKLLMQINKQMDVEIVSNYDLWAQSFEGIYRIKAKHFQYESMQLRQANIKGHFKGLTDNFYVDGSGSALDAPLDYKLFLVDKKPQKVQATMKGISLSELLALLGEANIVEGKIDIDVNMPDIGKDTAKGYGYVTLREGVFNRTLVKKLYGYSLPKGSHVKAKINAKLQGNELSILARANSNLFTLKVDEGLVNIKTKNMKAKYMVDIKDLRILSENKLAGPISAQGDVALENEHLRLSGESHSLGGKLHFDVAKKIDLTLDKVSLQKILYLLKQPTYANAVLVGKVNIEKSMKAGVFNLKVQEGNLNAKQIEKTLGYVIPKKNTFNIETEGKIEHQQLRSNVSVHSSIVDMDIDDIKYDIDKEKLSSKYSVKVHDIGLLMAKNKQLKHGALAAEGTLKYDKTLSIDGVTSGVAKKLRFHYDSKSATLDAKALMLEKVFALSGLPRYVKGNIDARVNVKEMKNLEGTFSLEGKSLVTDPKAMQKLLGKALKTKLTVKSKGTLKQGKMYAKSSIQTDMGTLRLSKTVFDTKTQVLKSNYELDIPNMQKLYPLTEKKLYGKMYVNGTLMQDKYLTATGVTTSLGGKITYTLKGNQLKSKIAMVPVERLMGMMGMSKTVLGQASGTVTYNLKNQVGVADISLHNFQIKPNKTTNTVKMFIGKDPSRIIFTSTKLHANMKGNITTYTLRAKGSRASINITQGRLNRKTQAHSARFKFVYEKYVITGKIKGTTDNPKVVIDPASMINSKVGKDISKGLNKVLKGKMGGFLKGFKF